MNNIFAKQRFQLECCWHFLFSSVIVHCILNELVLSVVYVFLDVYF